MQGISLPEAAQMTKVLASRQDVHKDPEQRCFLEGVSHSSAWEGAVLRGMRVIPGLLLGKTLQNEGVGDR